MVKSWQALLVAGALLGVSAELTAQTCIGNCGELGANGVVTAPPGGGTYRYVSTHNGITGIGLPGVGGSGSAVDGSVYRTSVFGAAGGDVLGFYFNYVTSDGAGFADYAWVRLLNSDLTEAALLFTARTTPGGNTVPGFGMPALNATLVPNATPIIAGGPAWAPLGGDSGRCFDVGCGYTGWIQSLYTIGTGGNYVLEFGVTNWNDDLYDSGLAWAGTQVGGVPIDPTDVPEPVSMILLGTGLIGVAAVRRRRKIHELS